MQKIYKGLIGQTAVGSVVSTISLALSINDVLIILGSIVLLEAFESCLGFGISCLVSKIRKGLKP